MSQRDDITVLKEEIIGYDDEMWEWSGAWAAKRTATPLRGRGKSEVIDYGEYKRRCILH